MTAAPVSHGQAFPVGWYGKIPAAGDFIARRVPPAFSEAWDRWLQAALDDSRARLGVRWRDDFLSMPVWRFVFSPGLVTPRAWAGVLVPSVDAVGRYFPLAIVAALSSARLDAVGTLFAARGWFDEMEETALSAIAPDVNAAAIDARISRRPFLEDWLRYPEHRGETALLRGRCAQRIRIALPPRADPERPLPTVQALAARLSEPYAAWLAEPSEMFGRSLLLCEGLPPGECVCAMMDGRWLEHGWAAPGALPVS